MAHTLPSVDVAACLGRRPGSLGVHPGTEDLRRACDLRGLSGPCCSVLCGGRPTVLPRTLPGTLNYTGPVASLSARTNTPSRGWFMAWLQEGSRGRMTPGANVTMATVRRTDGQIGG